MDKETAFTKFTNEVTNGGHTDNVGCPLGDFHIDWEPLWYGWAIANDIPFEDANEWYSELRYQHQHEYTPDDN